MPERLPNLPKTRRVFFALWPDDETRELIWRNMRSLNISQGREVRKTNLHQTLHFIGAVDELMLHCLLEAASQVKTPCFDLTLDSYGYFPRSRVLWLGCSERVEGLDMLYRQLERRLLECGYRAETRPFSPHITLLRKARFSECLPKPDPVVWRVKDFVLAESLDDSAGVYYKIFDRWPLASAKAF